MTKAIKVSFFINDVKQIFIENWLLLMQTLFMQKKSCKKCGIQFEITDEDLKFYSDVSPIFDSKKYEIPPPTFCPDCRQQRRLSMCNERNLYPDQCRLCKKQTLSQYPPHLNQLIYCRECWHSDKWDPCKYGQDFVFSRPFFEQFNELRNRVPSLALCIDGICINSEYIHYAGSSKNCYLIMHADYCEDCYYGYGFKKNTNCVDGFYNLHSELCYDCIDVHKCYDLTACQDCYNCTSSAFLRDCIGCKNCYLCTGLRNKEFYFENQQLTREAYQKRISEIDLGSYRKYQECKTRLKELEKDHVYKAYHGKNLENCIGDYLINCKDTTYSFDCEDIDHGKYCYQVVLGAKNIYDIYQYGTNLQQSYEGCIVGNNSYHLLFTQDGHMGSSDLYYCYYMESSKNCFGCTHMHRKSYCILNKQYTKEEYEKLVPKIINHMKETDEWGEFFPSSISSFGYNKTTAQLYYPLSKEEALKQGFKWDDYDPPNPKVARVIQAASLPDNIKEVSDDILQEAIECEVTKRLFKITPQELKYYRKKNVPLPRRSPDQRHIDRFKKRNPRKLWNRKCDKCGKDMKTSFSPDRPEKVYCEKCYLETVF
jgi:hypothetical protein